MVLEDGGVALPQWHLVTEVVALRVKSEGTGVVAMREAFLGGRGSLVTTTILNCLECQKPSRKGVNSLKDR
jgi:hypothetical protein